jgi:hypothetical protein
MTTIPDILAEIESMKVRTASICNQEGCTEVHWTIPNLDPEQIIELQQPLNLEWFRAGNTMCLLVFNSTDGYHITLQSVPVSFREQVSFIKQSV